MRRDPGTIALLAVTVAALTSQTPGRAWAQACGGDELDARQEGQDVVIEISREDMAGVTSLDGALVRSGPGGEVEVAFEISVSCTVWMPPPADTCGCDGGSTTVRDECVPPGEYTYALSRATSVSIAVADTDDPCLQGDAGDDGGTDGDDGGTDTGRYQAGCGCNLPGRSRTGQTTWLVALVGLAAWLSQRRRGPATRAR